MSIIFAYIAIVAFMAFEIWFWGEITKQTFSDGYRVLSVAPIGVVVFLTALTGVVLNGFSGGV